MYGMVNKAVEQLVVRNFGEETWEAIKEKAGIDIEVFISNDGYDDAITYRLVEAASAVLNLPAEQILHLFGEHWVLVTAREDYGALLTMHGTNLREFLLNLPNFHTRVQMIFPNLKPPRFEVSDATEQSVRLHYHTHRPGLAPFVVGLMHGLGKLYETPVTVTQTEDRNQGASHDVFLVQWN